MNVDNTHNGIGAAACLGLYEIERLIWFSREADVTNNASLV